jgi:Xaa-Pro aminopeptidase
MMAKNNVDVLLVLPDPEGVDLYFTNDSPGALVIFPLDGEPTAVYGMGATWAGGWVMADERGEASWVTDWRFHPAAVVSVLKERFADKRIGTLGMSDGTHAAPNGYISHGLWTILHDSLPNAEWVPVMREFAPIWMTKSAEDLALYRHAAAICESACEVAVATARPGVNELELYTAVQYEFLRNGASSPFGMILHSGKGNVGHFFPKWLHRAQPRRTIEWGDTIHIEMAVNVAAAHGQAQQSIAIGEVDETHAKAARLAREAYEIGLKVLRPGAKFADVCVAMGEPNQREGAWQMTPLLHSMVPLYCCDQPSKGIEQMPGLKERYKDFYERTQTGGEVILQPGMVFQFEPNAAFGRDYVDVGGNIIVTETGCEELNVMPTEMRVVK